MLTLGVFGINNDSVNTAVNVLILVLVVVWAALVFWTFGDARRRIDDPMLVACATRRRCSRSSARSSTRSSARRSSSTTSGCASSRCRPPRRA